MKPSKPWPFIFLAVVTARVAGSIQDPTVVILPSLNGRQTRVEKAGSQFTLTCQFESNSVQAPNKLKVSWLTANKKEILGSPLSSVYSQKLNSKTRVLFFNNVADRDQGTYYCQAEFDGQTATKNITIVVIEPARFLEHRTHEGGLLGDTLVVNCGAKGSPTPKLSITGKDGAPLPADRFKSNGQDLEITELKMEDRNMIILCSAAQVFPEYDYTNIESRKIRIDVFYAPKFSLEFSKRYGILGRNSSLICQVTDSNPPVKSFTFFKKGIGELKANNKYGLKIDKVAQRATLEIDPVTEDDFGQHECSAYNGKIGSKLPITFGAAVAPGPVKVTLKHSTASQIDWVLSQSGDHPGELPVTQFRVQYIRKELLETLVDAPYCSNGAATKNMDTWNKEARFIHFKRKSDNLYRIGGLRSDTQYCFRFRAVNEAGWADEVREIGAQTVTYEEEKEEEANSATHLTLNRFLVIFFTILFFSVT